MAAILSTDVAWNLTQPQATLATGIFTVTVGAVAFIAAIFNIRSNERQHREKLKEEGRQHREKEDTAERERRRAEVLAALVEGLTALNEAAQAVHNDNDLIGLSERDFREFSTMFTRPGLLVVAKLDILGLDEPRDALQEAMLRIDASYAAVVSGYFGDEQFDFDDASRRIAASNDGAVATFRKAVKQYDRAVGRSAIRRHLLVAAAASLWLPMR